MGSSTSDPPQFTRMLPAAKHFLENYIVLDQVVKSRLFKGKPETIASAMAGVPFENWQTSLKKMTRDPVALGTFALCDLS